MTKQEIEKAINNGESVWYADDCNDRVWEIDLNEKYKPEIYLDQVLYVYQDTKSRFKQELFIDKIFATKRQAEHYLKHANITRTETLPFLTWEEFLKEQEIRFVDNIGEEWHLYYSDEFIYLQSMFGYHGEKTRNPQNLGDLTEANFYKAYDECERLFKGRSDINEVAK